MLIQSKGSDGTPTQVEVEGQPVPGTDGLFAVCRSAPPNAEGEDDALEPPWSLTHSLSGFAVGWFWRPEDAHYVARQLYRAAPEAWRQTDPQQVVATTPKAVAKWIGLVRRTRLVPPQLLKTCAEFAREIVNDLPAEPAVNPPAADYAERSVD
jgi:hypothetical protein